MMEMIIWSWEISPWEGKKYIIREVQKQNEMVFTLKEDIIIVLNYQLPFSKLNDYFFIMDKMELPCPLQG